MGNIREELSCLKQYQFADFDGDFGIEIETETKNQGSYPEGLLKFNDDSEKYYCPSLTMWDVHRDGSLRNFGQEYVFKKPYTFEESFRALDEFARIFKDVKFIENSPSTSVHVHVNILKMTFTELANFLSIWVLYENALVEFCGETRRSNLFALPTRCSETTYTNIVSMFTGLRKGDSKAMMFSEQSVKYAALNLARMLSFGSVELRCMRGTTDVEAIKDWLRLINSIRMYAKTAYLTPMRVLNEYRDLQGLQVESIFGTGGAKLLRSACDGNLSEYTDRNIWYVKCIADSVRDWEALDTIFSKNKKEEPEKPKRKKKSLDEQVAMYAAHPPAQPLGLSPGDALNYFVQNGAFTIGHNGGPQMPPQAPAPTSWGVVPDPEVFYNPETMSWEEI